MTSTELLDRVFLWYQSSIPAGVVSVGKKTVEEMLEWIKDHNPEEAADVVICLSIWCRLQNINIEDEIERKLAINQSRTWEWDEANGVFKHVKK